MHNGYAETTELSQAKEPVISVRGVTKIYPGVVALSGIDIDLRPGEIHALLGENGAGKSTLINILSGTVAPTEGTITVGGTAARITSPRRSQELGIATVHQEQSLAPNLNGIENIFLGREMISGKSRFAGVLNEKGMRKRVLDLAHEFGLSDRDLGVPVEALGALKQHVVQILKALTFNTQVLILDEPTSGLADHERGTLFSYMRQLRQRGISLLWVTHRLDELFGLADTVTVFRDGKLVANADPATESADSLVRMMVGRNVLSASNDDDAGRSQRGRRFRGAEEEVIRLVSVSRQPLLHDISLHVNRGEILGLAGIAGAGRTETARVILGADRLDSGKILIKSNAVSIRSPKDARAHGIAYVPEERKTHAILDDFSIKRNITISDLHRTASAGLLLNGRRETTTAKEYVADLGIKTSSVHEKIRNLSGGNQQKVVIARCLFTQPDLIIFDEPTQGIDVGAKAEVYRLIYEFVDQGGAAIVISSDLPELIRVSDRVAVMREGSIVGHLEGTGRDEAASETSELGEHIISLATRGGAAA
ncbi:ribose transport system ATP-binding protein [Arthrobacter pigmenti]|uniref:Ribose transport system ATP-binding protein n=1 Tax=Arthrobacter pigmenti TaxID=271432 RepID=A0A846RQZ0_9MICC|nr:sugar ABC transporter ATP-binding protein [Arthrobacter pigmenti]NJC21516.1 ribose transport system ATP-binding protein [Arthrobacter pigmenti]